MHDYWHRHVVLHRNGNVSNADSRHSNPPFRLLESHHIGATFTGPDAGPNIEDNDSDKSLGSTTGSYRFV